MIDQKVIDELKAANTGVKLHQLTHGEDSIVVRSPSPAIYRKARANQRDSKMALDANELFVRDCLVFPDQKTFGVLLQEQPGLAETFATSLVEIAGAVGACEVVPL